MREFDSAAPPHDTTAQTLAPNESLLRRLGLQMTSFTQDGSSHIEMYSLHFSGSGDTSFLQSMVHIKRSVIADKAIGSKDQFLTDAVWNIIKNKVHAHFLMLESEGRQYKDCVFLELGTEQQHLVFGAIFIV